MEPCVCVVCSLIENEFSTKKFSAKLAILEQGRPKPALKNLKTKIKTCTRYFNVDMYQQNDWLTGCDTVCKLFCWPCLLFTNENGVWTKSGFSDLNNMHKVTKRHAISRIHLQAVIKEKVFGKSCIEHVIDDRLKISHRQHNELVEKNRLVLKRFIDVVCYLGKHEHRFRGHGEPDVATNKGRFMDQITFLAKYDEPLKYHLEQSTIFSGTSNRIQNDLISAVATVVLDTIKEEVTHAAFVAIVLGVTTDIADISQLSLVVRYVKNDGNIQERFLGFLDVEADTTAESLHKIVCDIIEDLKCRDKLVAQRYDGAALMTGQLGGLQANVRDTFPSALSVHCFADQLNLVLSQSVMHIKECKIFFATLSGMASFFSKSTKRIRAFDLIIKERLPKVAPTRWNYNGRLVLTVSEYRQPLIELFEEILENCCDWDTETLNMSRGYLDCLKNDYSFIFLINIFSEILPFTDNLYDILQNKSNDIGFYMKQVEDFKNSISGKRDEFDKFWENCINGGEDLQPNRKRLRIDDVGDLKTSYQRVFIEIVDQITEQLNHRINNFNNLKFLELCNFSKFKNACFPEVAFQSLIDNYGNKFDIVALRSELSVVYGTEEVNLKTNAKELLNFLKETGLDKAYSEVLKLCQLVLTIPATSVSVERSFSVRIKTFVRNSTHEDRLSKLPIISIEENLIQEISEHPRFYDDVINEFAKKDRRIELHYK